MFIQPVTFKKVGGSLIFGHPIAPAKPLKKRLDESIRKGN